MHERSFVMRYGIALVASAAALLLRAASDPWLGDQYLFSFFYPAVAIAVWFGGVGPALLAVALALLSSTWWLVPPRHGLGVPQPISYVGAVIFVIGGAIITTFGEVARRNLRRAGDSERRKDEALRQLAESQRLYRAAGELIPFGVWVANARGELTYLSQSFLDMLGVGFEQAREEWARRMEAPEFEAVVNAWQRTVDRGADSFEHEFRLRDKNGQVRTVLSRGVPLRDATSAAITAWVGVHFDISGRKLIEQSLQASERQHRNLIETAHEGIWLIDRDARTMLANERMAEMLGCGSVAEVMRREVMDFCYEEDRAQARERIRGNLEGRNDQFDFRFRRLDGREVLVLCSSSPVREADGTIIGALGMFSDITERKRAEQERSRRERELRILTDAVPALISYVDSGLRYRFVNRAYEQWFEARREDVLGRHVREVLGEPAFERVRPHAEAALAGERVEYEAELPYRSGGSRHVMASYVPDVQPDGRVAGYFALIFDVTERKRVEHDLARLAAIVECSEDAIIGCTPAGIITSFNPGAERIYGYRAEEVIGKQLSILLPPDRADDFPAIMQRLRRGERTDHYQAVRRRKNGELFDVSVTVSPIRDAEGKLVGASKIARDITWQQLADQALRESEQRFRDLADNIAQLAWMADETGSIFWYNRRWFEFTGATLEQVRGWGWASVHHPDHVDRVVEKIRRCFASGEVWEDTFPLRGRDGNYRWFLSRAVPIRDSGGNVLRWFGTNTDVTEQRQAEEALREADRRKDDFLAMLGHELRNPLAPIRNAVQVLASPSAHEREWARDVIDRQVRHLTRLVDDLLDVSRITRGMITLQTRRIAMADVINQAVETSRPMAMQRQQTLEVDLPEERLLVEGDEARLAQAIQNLLHNATKFTPEGGRVRLTLARERNQRTDDESDEAVVRVRDTGVGIPPDMLVRVFEPFAQADRSLDRSFGGLGIGLTLVKTLIELHGGRVEARSEGLGTGSEFIIRLPLVAVRVEEPPSDALASAPASSAARAASEASNPAAPRQPLRVLVVDDNADSARSMSLLLKLWGHRSEVAQDGNEAVERAVSFRPDVVLLDIGLPGMSGYDVARELRRRPESRHVMLVAMTGYGQQEDRQRTAESGFDHHLVKPVDPTAIERLLASMDNGARADDIDNDAPTATRTA